MPSKLKLTLASALACLVLVWASSVAAQPIDVFENQDAMAPGELELGSKDDAETIASDDEGEDAAPRLKIEGISSGDGSALNSPGRADGVIKLQFERRNSVIYVEASVRNQNVYFMLDTGATYTTLTSGFARSAGVYPRPTYPRTMVQTAAGPSQTQFGIMDNLRLGGQPHSQVTFTICDACGGGRIGARPVVGVLGLNVLRRYRISIDDSQGSVELVPNASFTNRRHDVEPWLNVGFFTGTLEQATIRSRFDIQIRNLAPHTARHVKLELKCHMPNGSVEVAHRTLESLPAAKATQVRIDSKFRQCFQIVPELLEAQW